MIAPWLRLLRLPSLASAASNVVAGAALGSMLAASPVPFVDLIRASLASVAVYACGLVWNDLADHEFDRVARPERPLPRGEISRKAAWLGTLTLLGVAVCAAWDLSEPVRTTLAAIAGAAFLYDFALKQSPFLGPIALGFCRAANLAVGLLLVSANAELPADLAGVRETAIVHYCLYVAILSSFARMEDSKVEPARARLELFALFLVGTSFALRWTAYRWNEDMAIYGALLPAAPLLFLAAFCLWRAMTWKSLDPSEARKTVVWLLAGIGALDAATAAFAWGAWGFALLAPAALGPTLRRWISST